MSVRLFSVFLLFAGITAQALGQTVADPGFDRISLSVTASAQVTPDRLVVTLRSQAQADTAAEAAARVNASMAEVADQLAPFGSLQWATLGYATRPIYATDSQGRVQNPREIQSWEVWQDLSIESTEPALVAEQSGALQKSGLLLRGSRFEVSDELAAEKSQALINDALARFSSRSEQVSEQLGARGYRIVHLQISEAGNSPPVPMMASRAMMAEDAAAPTFQPGLQTLQISVQGEIALNR